MTSLRTVVSPDSATRRRAARDWLAGHATTGALVIGETLAGPHDLMLDSLGDTPAVMGWRRVTLGLLANELAATRQSRRVPAGGLARDAVIARTLLRVGGDRLGRLGPVADTPGFGRAVGDALDELRLGGVGPDVLAAHDRGLAALHEAVDEEWRAAGLADRAATLAAATDAVRDGSLRHFLLDLPLLFYDARIATRLETDLVDALVARAPDALATVPSGDLATLGSLGTPGSDGDAPGPEPVRSLERLKTHLFTTSPPAAKEDGSLTVFSAPGEGRECVEIARRLLELAEDGTAFDRCAILLRQPADYRPYVEEALGRAEIPAWYARGVRRPDPAGRAFLALLRCRQDDYSARRFAEYLSIGEVPADGEESDDAPPAETWTPPIDHEDPLDVQMGFDFSPEPPAEVPAPDGDEKTDGPVRAGTVRVPRRWEELLVESSVVGGLDRWERRLDSLGRELEMQRAGLEVEDIDDPRVARIERSMQDLRHLREYALSLLRSLADLPGSATWAEWLEALGALAERALRNPRGVHGTLAALAPMGPVGPVTLTEVIRALGPRLLEASEPPRGNRFGKVFVGPIESARGLVFDVVFVPGMAERVFPPKISEDPILLDSVRDGLNGAVPEARLPTNAERVAGERLALSIAVGAAREEVVLSYPRIEADKSRPRVPSFYMLEAVRAGEGRLPRFEELAARAEDVSDARIGWPAPRVPARAIDEAEYDLAVLAHLGKRGDEAVTAAGHLLHTNPHLARALRFRAYRWEVRRWTWADGLVDLDEGAAAALARHSPDSRPFSATALQHFAACPYRFYLYTILGLSPREEPVGIETMDPLQRGSLVHQVQFELLTRLQRLTESGDADLLPVTPENLEEVRAVLDEVLDRVAADFEDRLVPAIERVWSDGIEAIRLDLREWLYRVSRDPSPYEPVRFELSFGLPRGRDRDANSIAEAVDLGVGLRLRGAIDLVERTPGGMLRVTDHKTGRYRPRRNAIIQGGELLQPVLYGLAARQIFPEDRVASGRLYYCTSDGEFRDHEVPINEETTRAARTLADVLGSAFGAGAFQALPRKDACTWCDYRTVCGPDEERRIRRKPAPVELKRLRDYP